MTLLNIELCTINAQLKTHRLHKIDIAIITITLNTYNRSQKDC